jgi:YidC/Oxa1 family membrane protein insertase
MIAQKLQPAIKKIQEQYRTDRQKQTEAILAAYKEYNLNPFSGFLFFLVQLPILIALYHLFLNIFSPDIMNDVYGFLPSVGTLNEVAFGLLNLKERSILVVVLAAVAQYWQTRLMFKSQPIGGDANISEAQKISQRIAFLGPILTVVIFFNFPSAMSLYWLTSSLFSVGQQYYVNYQLAHGKLGITDKKTD